MANVFNNMNGYNGFYSQNQSQGYNISTAELRDVFTQADIDDDQILGVNELRQLAQNCNAPVRSFFEMIAGNPDLRRRIASFNFDGEASTASGQDGVSLNNLLRLGLRSNQSSSEDGVISYTSLQNDAFTCHGLANTLKTPWQEDTGEFPPVNWVQYPSFGQNYMPVILPGQRPFPPPSYGVFQPVYDWFQPAMNWLGGTPRVAEETSGREMEALLTALQAQNSSQSDINAILAALQGQGASSSKSEMEQLLAALQGLNPNSSQASDLISQILSLQSETSTT